MIWLVYYSFVNDFTRFELTGTPTIQLYRFIGSVHLAVKRATPKCHTKFAILFRSSILLLSAFLHFRNGSCRSTGVRDSGDWRVNCPISSIEVSIRGVFANKFFKNGIRHNMNKHLQHMGWVELHANYLRAL